MKMRYLCAAIIAASCGVLGMASSSVEAATSRLTQAFVQSATINNQFEIQASQVALRNSTNDEIKDFAQKILDEHAQIASQMKTAVSNAHVSSNQATSPLDAKHRKILANLEKTSGDKFDDVFIKTQLEAHDDAVKLFRDYAKNGDNDSLRQFASQTLPTLQQHQQDAEQFKESF
jgi:putative membrane protein